MGLVLEEKVTAPSVSKPDNRVEFGLGFLDKLMRTSLMVVWDLMEPSWCPSPNADSILRATQDVQRELNSDCNLRDLNIVYNLITTASKSDRVNIVVLPGRRPEDLVTPGSCLAKVCGLEGHMCGGLDCVKFLAKQHKQLTVLFGNIIMKAKMETELIADCHGGTEVNLVTALGFYSVFDSLESLLNLEQKHEVLRTISVEVFPGVLQTEQKYFGKWREAIEAEMNMRQSETYRRPWGARYLPSEPSGIDLGSDVQKPIHSTLRSSGCEEYEDDRGSSLLSAEMCEISKNVGEILRFAMPGKTKNGLEPILGKSFMGYTSGNFSDFERQKQRGSIATDFKAVDEKDEIHRVIMAVKPLLEASGKRYWRSIMLTQDELPCHCFLQTWWYPGRSNLMLI